MLFSPFIKKYSCICPFPTVSAVGVRPRSTDWQRLPAAVADPNSRGQQWRRSLQDHSHACLQRNVLRSEGAFSLKLHFLLRVFSVEYMESCSFVNLGLVSVPTCLPGLGSGCCRVVDFTKNPLLCCLPTHQVVSLHWNRRQHGPRCKVPLRKGEDFYHTRSTPHIHFNHSQRPTAHFAVIKKRYSYI